MNTIAARHGTQAVSYASGVDPEEPVYLGLRQTTWVKFGVLALLFGTLFWPNLRRLWEKTNPFSGEDNWKHSPFVPLIGLYYLYINRDQIRRTRATTAWSGLPIALGGILFFGYGIWPGQNDWFKDLGMVVALFGLVTLICGWEMMRILWFPIVFLICALPWPGLFYSTIAGPLQNFAATVAVRILTFLGISAGQFGTKIFIEGKNHVIRTLNVAEACAGLRSLMSFVAIAGAVAFLSFRPLWQKLLMVFSAIPIAIFCNTMRVTVQGLFDRYGGAQWSESFAHAFLGLMMMIPAFFLILLVGWILQNIFIEEVVDKKALRAGYSGATRGKTAPLNAQRVQAVPRPYSTSAVPRTAAISRGMAAIPPDGVVGRANNVVGRLPSKPNSNPGRVTPNGQSSYPPTRVEAPDQEPKQ